MSVDTLGLELRVLVTAAGVSECEGGKQVLKRVHQMGMSASRLQTMGGGANVWLVDAVSAVGQGL